MAAPGPGAEKDTASVAEETPKKGRKRKRPNGGNRQSQSGTGDSDGAALLDQASAHANEELGPDGKRNKGPEKVTDKLAGFITEHDLRVVNGKPFDLYYHSSQTTQVFGGVQKGALILTIGGVPVTSDKEIVDEIRKATGPTKVTLFGRPASRVNGESRSVARAFKGRRETSEHSALAPSAVCTQDTVDASVQPEWDAHFDEMAGQRYYRHRATGQLEWESSLEFNVDLQDSNTRRNLFVREGCTLAQLAACNVSACIAENVIRIEGPVAALQDLKLSLIKISLVGAASVGNKKSNKLKSTAAQPQQQQQQQQGPSGAGHKTAKSKPDDSKSPGEGKAKTLAALRAKLQAASAEERYEDARRIKKEIEDLAPHAS